MNPFDPIPSLSLPKRKERRNREEKETTEPNQTEGRRTRNPPNTTS